MPRRLPPMSDLPREAPCPQCVQEGSSKPSGQCQKPSLHQVIGRFWDKILHPDADPISNPRRGLQPLNDYSPPSVPANQEMSDPEQDAIPRRNILPPLPPHIEMAVMRKLYMSGMTISPRSRQIQPLPELGEGAPYGMGEVDDEDDGYESDTVTKVTYDPSLLDENLVHELELDDLLCPETSLPARAKLNPISTPRPLKPASDLFTSRQKARRRKSRVEENEEHNHM